MKDDKTAFGKWLAKYDNFRSIPAEFRRSTKMGGVMTIATYALLLILLLAEVGSFFRTSYATLVRMDENNDKQIQINFDILMHDLPCRYLRIAVFDSFGDERVDAKSEVFHYIPVDTNGLFQGHAYDSADANRKIAEVDSQPPAAALDEELDADWSSTDDHFKHKSFVDAIVHHDYTLVLFYADWCSHCRLFHPTWNEMKGTLGAKETFKNSKGDPMPVKLLKINCVDFGDTCSEQRIHAFPMIKLYTSDFERGGPGIETPEDAPITFTGKRSIENFRSFLTETIAKSNHERLQNVVKQEHASMHQGCQVRGYLTVPRVPGEFHLEANADQVGGNLNPALTNVSHTVKHLSFGNVAPAYKMLDLNINFYSFPSDVLGNMMPLDGKSFSVREVGQAPQHYLKIVSTTMDTGTQVAYQITHSDRIASVDQETKIPQAKFMYDLSPMSVKLKLQQKRWYEFLTSLCALLGGFYTVAKLTSRTILNVVNKMD